MSDNAIDNTKNPRHPDFIEPSLEEQLAEQALRERLSIDIFAKTGYKVDMYDPMIDSVVIVDDMVRQIRQQCHDSINEQLEFIEGRLESYTDNITDNLVMRQEQVIAEFDTGLNELREIVTTLNTQKEAIVADVWTKMQMRVNKQIEEQLSKDLQSIANNANNKVNNQRNLLLGIIIGGMGGLVIGMLLVAIMFV